MVFILEATQILWAYQGSGTCSPHGRELCCGYVIAVVVVVRLLLELHNESDNPSWSTGVLSGGLRKEGSAREHRHAIDGLQPT